ncbi:phosphotransferase [Aestuariibacter halophilus]|uniref:Phosphotransferase n=1 Tax=Fluctibacter halophilus TaxID=226011 RepID=A0ABS8GCH4_9ALTE|nr:phosphotransferase [Aestuariibacter halophilus]MCC2617811.1 phosphotransferase [Aestuariibacter halophilus]
MNTKTTRQQALQRWADQQPGFQCPSLTMIFGDASFRRYFRFAQSGRTVIAVDAPPEHENSQQFIAVAEAYRQNGVPVPEVLACDLAQGFYLLEDFGDCQFAHQLNEDSADSLYRRALDCLPAIQQVRSAGGQPLPAFDDALLDNEFYLFTHWLLQVHLGLTLTPQQQAVIDDTFVVLRDAFKAQPQVGVHRDYHSRNLMIRDDGSLGIIDFQDAVLGPVCYDAVSLLRDCYQVWPAAQVDAWIQALHQRQHSDIPFEQYRLWFDMTGMQRHVKASGIFARLCHRDGKEGYLLDVPRTLDYLITVGQRWPQTQAFASLVAEVVKPAVLAVAEQSTAVATS